MSNSSFFSGTGITANQTTAIETSVAGASQSAVDAAASALLASQKAAVSTTKSNDATTSAATSNTAKLAALAAQSAAETALSSATTQANNSSTDAATSNTRANASAQSAAEAVISAATATTKANEAAASAQLASDKSAIAVTAANSTSGSAAAAVVSSQAATAAKVAALAAKVDAEDAESVAIANAALALSRQQLASTAASQALGYRNEAAAASGANSAATASANAAAASAVTAIAAKDAALLITGNYLGAHSSAPTTATGGGSLVIGMLYFNTTTNVMMVYGSGGWGAAGSSVNGTSERKTYIATANQTTFAATYDSGFVDIWQNGAKLYVTDFSATNGSTIVLASGAAVGDTIEIVAFGTFSVANQTFTGTTTVADLVVTGSTNLGSTDLTTTGKMLYSNLYAAVSDLPSASTYHGMFAHVHATGLAYYAHAGAWVALSRASDVMTNAEIRSAVEAASDSNVFTDADHSKLNAIEASATADQTNAEIKTAVEASADIALGGNPTTTTQGAGNNTTRVATTAFTQAAITALVDSSPASLNTLNELAAALGDDANFSTTVTNSIAAKLPLAGGAMTGNVTFGDSNKIVMGAGSDLQIYHDGSNSYISDQGTNDLKILATDFQLKNAADNEFMITGVTDGAVTLYHNNAAKIATSSGGATVTGNLTTSGETRTTNINTASSTGTLTMFGGASNKGGTIELSGGNNTGATGSGIVFKTGASTANPATRMAIDLNGNVLVGGTSATPWSLTSGSGAVVRSEGYGGFAASGAAIELNRVGSNGNIANLRVTGVTKGTIGTSSSGHIMIKGSASGHKGLKLGSAEILPVTNSGGVDNGSTNLGSGASRFNEVYLSGGVFLGGTGTANKLDDYETGSVSLKMKGGNGDPSTQVNVTGTYVKIGRLVSLRAQNLNLNNTGAAGPMFFEGLPFAANGAYGIGNIGEVNDICSFTNQPFIVCSGNLAYVYQNITQANASAVSHHVDTAGAINISVTYETNS